MSTFRVCCCFSGSNRSDKTLPLYLTPYNRGPLQFESLTRQQNTRLRVQELANRSKRKSFRFKSSKTITHDTTAALLSRLYLSFNQAVGRETNEQDDSNILPGAVIKHLKRVSMLESDDTAVDAVKRPVTPNVPSPRPLLVSMEGQLLKFTNVIKGYQLRWVVLNADVGNLEYYENKEKRKLKPRGGISLQAAKVAISTMDPQLFVVTAANGETFKLKAQDDKEKLIWAQRIVTIVDHCTGKFSRPVSCTQNTVIPLACGSDCCGKTKKAYLATNNSKNSNAFISAKEYCKEAEDFCKHLDDSILGLPKEGVYMNSLDTDLLLLKATSNATLQCMQDCISLLQLAHLQLNQCTSPNSSLIMRPSYAVSATPSIFDASGTSLPSPEDEIPDVHVMEEKSIGNMDENKTIIFHLLSQLKLGMDLTKVTLPTFILEKRSLLELFSDCMSHPDKFVNIPKIHDPQSRFLAIMEWYLTSFHCGKLGTSAKKPYNPIMGETFHCSWHVPDVIAKDIYMTYTAEQVSHHPPVSAFYVECLQHRMKMNASIYTKSKFMGMSIGVSMVGKVHLRLEDYNEEYIFSMPSAYARSIFTIPWVELGDKLHLICEKTGYTANITFHTKPFYGGKLHHVTAEAKNVNTGDVICKVSGQWNSVFEFTYPMAVKMSKTVDVNTLKVFPKYIRPLNKQMDYESRKLWSHVTKALLERDVKKATECKQILEKIQREKMERQQALHIEYEAKFFKKVNGVWLYKTLPDNFATVTYKS